MTYWRRNIKRLDSVTEAELDKRFIDALREWLGYPPLYYYLGGKHYTQTREGTKQ